jgi:hypothetical protein
MPTTFNQFVFRALQRGVLGVALALGIAATALAETPAEFDSAFVQFSRARQGDEDAIVKSAQAFAALLKAEPLNPLLMAYTGAATSMQANTTWLPWKKMSFAEDGLALLDKALALLTAQHNLPSTRALPAALEVRFIAANTFLAVPGFMNRGARGAKLLSEILASPLLGATPLAFRGDVWMVAAAQAIKDKRTQNARNYLDDVVRTSAPQSQAARAQLKAIAS